jgi:hypothetical protein
VPVRGLSGPCRCGRQPGAPPHPTPAGAQLWCPALADVSAEILRLRPSSVGAPLRMTQWGPPAGAVPLASHPRVILSGASAAALLPAAQPDPRAQSKDLYGYAPPERHDHRRAPPRWRAVVVLGRARRLRRDPSTAPLLRRGSAQDDTIWGGASRDRPSRSQPSCHPERSERRAASSLPRNPIRERSRRISTGMPLRNGTTAAEPRPAGAHMWCSAVADVSAEIIRNGATSSPSTTTRLARSCGARPWPTSPQRSFDSAPPPSGLRSG